MNELASAIGQLERAKHHIQHLQQCFKEYSETRPYERVDEIEENTGDTLIKIKMVKAMPVELDAIASDAVMNLRNALDHVGYAAALAVNPAGKSKSTYFPFAEDAKQLANLGRSGGSAAIPSEVFDTMATFRPYRDGGDQIFWALGKLANANKHRLTTPAITYLKQFSATLRVDRRPGADPNFGGGALYNGYFDSGKGEAVLMRTRPSSVTTGEIFFEPSLRFSLPDELSEFSAFDVLNHQANVVGRVLQAVSETGVRIQIFANK